METYRFSVVIEQNDLGFQASCPEFDDCSVQCDTYDEAIERIKETIMVRLEEKLQAGEEVPQINAPYPMSLTINYSLN